MNRTNTDLGHIRTVLADADATTCYAAGIKHGHHASTVAKWIRRRASMGRPWPTDEDVAAWRIEHAEQAPQRRQRTDYAYRKYRNGGPVQRPALGTTRRLQALAALGWTQVQLGARLGVSDARVGHLTEGRSAKLHPATADAVARLYDEISMTVPADHDGPRSLGQTRVHARARANAERRGYFPPLAWDDIDDPNERPTRGYQKARSHHELDEAVVERVMNGETDLRTTFAEKCEIMTRWVAAGRTKRSLISRMGWGEGRYDAVPEQVAS